MGDHREDENGRVLSDWAASLGLVPWNCGDRPTFFKEYAGGVSESHIDITFVSNNLDKRVRDWKVLDAYTSSLHNYITFEISSRVGMDTKKSSTRWSWRKYDKSKRMDFIATAKNVPLTATVSTGTEDIGAFLGDACNSCMSIRRYKGGKILTPWWSKEISDLRSTCQGTQKV